MSCQSKAQYYVNTLEYIIENRKFAFGNYWRNLMSAIINGYACTNKLVPITQFNIRVNNWCNLIYYIYPFKTRRQSIWNTFVFFFLEKYNSPKSRIGSEKLLNVYNFSFHLFYCSVTHFDIHHIMWIVYFYVDLVNLWLWKAIRICFLSSRILFHLSRELFNFVFHPARYLHTLNLCRAIELKK